MTKTFKILKKYWMLASMFIGQQGSGVDTLKDKGVLKGGNVLSIKSSQ